MPDIEVPDLPDVPDEAPSWVHQIRDLGVEAVVAGVTFVSMIVAMIVMVAVNAGGDGDGPPPPTSNPGSTETVAPTSSSTTPSTVPDTDLALLDNPARMDFSAVVDGRTVDSADLTQQQLDDIGFTAADPFTEPSNRADNGRSPQGQFRLICTVSHWRYDDPIVSPNRPGGHDHLHLFFGNTEADATSTGDSLLESGASTCQGGPLNRSGYWMPAVMAGDDTVVVPSKITLYYKTYYDQAGDSINPLPNGVMMPAHTGPNGLPATTFPARQALSWGCYNPALGLAVELRNTIPGTDSPPCPAGHEIRASIQFPQCLAVDDAGNPRLTADDLVSHTYNLERAPRNHRSTCPDTHPYRIPQITYLVNFETPAGGTSDWRLSCDHDLDGDGRIDHPGGCLHADWLGAWNDAALDRWHTGCIEALRNCSIGQTSGPRAFARITGDRLAGRLQDYVGPQELRVG